jgi:MoaA/NifB/PqqE/SkfB family radical SAM enzyme
MPVDKSILKQYNKIRDRKKSSLICHAPFSSLFFSEYGEILPCYYNKNIVFGNYPETGPEEAWFGEKMNSLREHLKNNDLTFGCQDCQLYMQQKNYYSVGAWKYDYLPVNRSKWPVSMDFQISNICNLACVMCNGEFSQTVRQKTECKSGYKNPYDSSFVEKIEKFFPHLKEAAFTGGEVFLINQYYDIWDRIAEINPAIRISITTNGTILNEKVKSYLEKLDFNITLSLDSVHKENFESIRRFSHFETVMESLDYYIDYTKRKGTLFTVKICPMRQNWKEIPDMVNFLNKKNVSFLFNNVVFPPYCTLWNLPSAELQEIIQFLDSKKYQAETKLQKINIDRVSNLGLQLMNWKSKAMVREQLYPDIESYNIERLTDMIRAEILKYLGENRDIGQDTSYGQEVVEVFEKLKKQVTDPEVLRRALIYYFSMPVHRLLSEFNIRNMEKILDRTWQAGQISPPEISENGK